MDTLKPFKIPIKGLKPGIHQYQFDVDRLFFSHFEKSPIEEGNIKVELKIDKRPEMLVLDFDFFGKTATSCDRCLANIQLPLTGKDQLVVKFSEIDKEDDEEVVYLPWETPELNVAPFIYENIVLSLPMIKVYDCETEAPQPCDKKMLEYLNNDQSIPSAEAQGEEPENSNSIWSELKKNFKSDN